MNESNNIIFTFSNLINVACFLHYRDNESTFDYFQQYLNRNDVLFA